MREIDCDTPVISVITPSYNSEQYIGDTIRSVLAQTFTKWEMIVVDDCSQDTTCEIVMAWTNKDPRIRLIENARNLGPGPTRNIAVANARGRYIAFLDSDDIWYSRKLERQLADMQMHNVALSFTSYELINSEGTRLGRKVRAPGSLTYARLLGDTRIGCLTVMIDRRQVINLEMPDIPARQPLVLWLRILRQTGQPARGIDEVLAAYRIRANSISSNKMQAARQVWRVYRRYEKLSLAKSIYYFLGYAVRGMAKNFGLAQFRRNQQRTDR